MAFSISGTTITQVGVDPNLRAIDTIDGVTALTTGSAGPRQRRTYRLNGRKLDITGTLTYTEGEELQFNTLAPDNSLEISGELNIGVERTVNGEVRSPDWVAIVMTREVSVGASDDNRDIEINGIYRHLGGIVKNGGPIGFNAGSTVVLKNCKYVGEAENISARIRQRSTALTIENVIVEGSLRFDFYQPPVSATGFKPSFTSLGGFQVLSGISGGSNDTFVFREQGGEGLTYMADAFAGARLEFINTVYEPQLLVTHNRIRSIDPYYPITLVKKEFQVKAVDRSNNPIDGAIYGFVDVNNGNRPDRVAVWNGGATADYRGTQIYTGTLVNGLSPLTEFIVETLREGQSRSGIYTNAHPDWVGSTTTVIDSRTNADRRINIPVRSYHHVSSEIAEARMHGAGVAIFETQMLPDLSITEQDRDIVANYTGITINFATRFINVTEDHTLDEIYDYIKYRITRLDHILTPEFATGVGGMLNIGDYDLYVDFDVTISSGEAFNAVRTTGDVTIDGTSDIGVIDSTGISVTVATNVANTGIFYQINGGNGVYRQVSSDGTTQINVPEDAVITLTAKAPGYLRVKRTLNTANDLVFNIELARDVFVDLNQPTTAIITNAPAIGVTDHTNRIYADYNNNDRKLYLRFGHASTRGQLAISVRVFDLLLSGRDGLEFLHNYTAPDDLDSVLFGEPYSLQQGHVIIDQEGIELTRITGLAPNLRSGWGLPTFNRDGIEFYQTPSDAENQFVIIDGRSQNIFLTSNEALVAFEILIRNMDLTNTLITSPTAQAVENRLNPHISEIQKDIDEIDSKLGNTIIPTQIFDIGGTEHGVLGVPNISALARVFSLERTFEEDTVRLHIDVDQVSKEGTGGEINFDLDVYAVLDVDSVDVSESFSDTTKYDAFRAANASRRIFHQDETSHVLGRHTVPVEHEFNRIVILFRNNTPTESTLIFRFNEFRISLHDAILNITEHVESIREKTNNLPDDITASFDTINANTGAITNQLNQIQTELSSVGVTIDYNAFWNVLTSTITTQGSFGRLIRDNLDAPISGLAVSIENGLLDDADGRAFLDAIKTQVGEKLSEENITAATIASSVWSTAISTLNADGEIGNLLRERLNSLRFTNNRIDANIGAVNGNDVTISDFADTTELLRILNILLQRGQIERKMNTEDYREEYIDSNGVIVLAFNTYDSLGNPSINNITRKVPLTQEELDDINP